MGIRLLIVDDHPVVCEGFSQLFEFVEGIDVVGTAGTGAQGIEAMGQLAPDVVLVDLSLPDIDGVTLAGRMHNDHPDTRVVIFTGGAEPREVRRAVAAGVDGMLMKTMPVAQLSPPSGKWPRGGRSSIATSRAPSWLPTTRPVPSRCRSVSATSSACCPKA